MSTAGTPNNISLERGETGSEVMISPTHTPNLNTAESFCLICFPVLCRDRADVIKEGGMKGSSHRAHLHTRPLRIMTCLV